MPPKKKTRTPPPPRRVQAPKARTTEPGDMGMRQRALLYGIAGSGILALAIVVLVIVVSGGGTAGAKAAITTIRSSGCQFKTYPALPRVPHYTSLTPSTPPQWNSFPPSSGRHYYQPVIFGIYTDPVREIQAVHNLEHGAMVLQYGDKVSAADVDRITQWYRADPNAVLVAPLPALRAKVAMTSWTRWSECAGFNEKAANAFRKAFRYHAPEQFPKSYLNPGE